MTGITNAVSIYCKCVYCLIAAGICCSAIVHDESLMPSKGKKKGKNGFPTGDKHPWRLSFLHAFVHR